jgi:hypothetical protein
MTADYNKQCKNFQSSELQTSWPAGHQAAGLAAAKDVYYMMIVTCFTSLM